MPQSFNFFVHGAAHFIHDDIMAEFELGERVAWAIEDVELYGPATILWDMVLKAQYEGKKVG